MILLDTNVLSEPLKSEPFPKVIQWLDRQAAETLYISTISYAEFRFGVMRMPEGKRKNDLAPRVEQALHLFKNRTLTFDLEAAEHLAQILTRTEKIGKKTPAPDAYIAAIAIAHRFVVATRNVDHFHDTGVSIINPWE
jgi:predicted nucleic acid-binding protein